MTNLTQRQIRDNARAERKAAKEATKFNALWLYNTFVGSSEEIGKLLGVNKKTFQTWCQNPYAPNLFDNGNPMSNGDSVLSGSSRTDTPMTRIYTHTVGWRSRDTFDGQDEFSFRSIRAVIRMVTHVDAYLADNNHHLPQDIQSLMFPSYNDYEFDGLPYLYETMPESLLEVFRQADMNDYRDYRKQDAVEDDLDQDDDDDDLIEGVDYNPETGEIY